jgi:hypothetical protein
MKPEEIAKQMGMNLPITPRENLPDRRTFPCKEFSSGRKPVLIPWDCKIGDWAIKTIYINEAEAFLSNIKIISEVASSFKGHHELLHQHGEKRAIHEPGIYQILTHKDDIVMSSTPAEHNDHDELMKIASGRVLITGLGLGLIARLLLSKKEVEHITILEKSKEVIDMVGYIFKEQPVKIIHADALSWIPPTGSRWDVVWHDIWFDISDENVEQMEYLRTCYQPYADKQLCWVEEECQTMKKAIETVGYMRCKKFFATIRDFWNICGHELFPWELKTRPLMEEIGAELKVLIEENKSLKGDEDEEN